MYHSMGCPSTLAEIKSHRLYRRWMNKRAVKESLSVNQAPEVADIRFEDDEEDEHEVEVAPGVKAPDGTAAKPTPSRILHHELDKELKCRKCRRTLAKGAFIVNHTPLRSDPKVKEGEQCAHIFLHPLSWMKETLGEGQLDGRLTCPNKKCGANVGKFAWQGLRCSCGGWVTPAFAVARGRVDEAVSRPVGRAGGVAGSPAAAGGGMEGQDSGGGALRLPPGMRKGNL